MVRIRAARCRFLPGRALAIIYGPGPLSDLYRPSREQIRQLGDVGRDPTRRIKFRVKTLIGMVGERKAVALLREGVEMLDGIEALIRDEKIDCAFLRCGRFRGAMRPQHYEAMARDMEDLVPRGEQSREIGTTSPPK